MTMVSQLHVADSRPEDWVYVSEGGATIVFSYRGTENPQFNNRVLRLRKAPLLDNNNAVHDIEEQPDDPMIAFHRDVISYLVPQTFLPDLDVILLNESWLDALERLRDGDRPLERRKKDKIDKRRKKGILATDLVGGGGIIAVEIKPKWGFLPREHHLSQETASTKTSTCRFCMHTHLRSQEGAFPTDYCPMDLYSRNEPRMVKAIHNLWDAWVRSDGSLNNLRVFVSGKMVKPSHDLHGGTIGLSAARDSSVATNDFKETLTKTVIRLLLDTGVLDIISNLQRTLDELDIEGLSKLYSMTVSDNAKSGLASIATDPTPDDWRDFIACYQTSYCKWNHANPDPKNIRHYLISYLLSASFKDCSIILRFSQSDQSLPAAHSVSIIDLDLKPTNKLGEWEELDRRIVEGYRAGGQQKRCDP
ncbi:inositol-pentakisphosphate 2-kinase [Pisolithus marmoratus]|nr:inositol-pentakisphosphate 2-kinase [Pisolithus marmoratus]